MMCLLMKTSGAQNIDRKVISNCTVTFDVIVTDTTASQNEVDLVAKMTKRSYVKNNKSRNDFLTPSFKQTTIFRGNNDTVIVLKEVGAEKYISYVDTRKFGEKQDRFEGIKFSSTRESKNILGYECKMAQAQMPDGTFLNVYYAPSIVPSNKDFELQFKDIPGFVLEYEGFLDDRKTKVKFTATSFDTSLVPESMFDWPKDGYRLLKAQ